MKTNWQIKKLGEVCEIEIGKTPARANKKFWDSEKKTNNIWLSIRDLSNANNKIIDDSSEYISDEGAKLSKIIKKGTLLVSFKLTLGRLAFAGKDLYTNEAIASLNIKNEREISKQYLYQYLSFFDWNKATKGDVKVKGKTLNKAKLKEILISFPPLPEQKRIVKMLDEVFEKLEKVKEGAEKNLANSKELFESYLQNIFANKGKDWEEKKLGEIIKLEYGKPLDKKDRVMNGLYSVYGANGEKAKSNKFFYDKPSIIIGRKGSAGELRLVEGKFWPLDVTYFITFDNKKYDLFFIYFILKRLELPKLARGVKPGINRNDVYSIYVDIPKSLVEQKEIVKKLDELSGETKKLENIYKEKLKNIEELKKSILQKAFTGNL